MLGAKRKVAEVITISEGTDAKSDSDRPGWLPDGWERVCRWNKNLDISFYYPCPECAGITLRTKDEVLRHCLYLCEDAPLKLQPFSQNEQEEANPRHPRPVRRRIELTPVKDGQKSGSSKEGGQFGNGLFDSIPCDWVIEIRRGPSEYGKIYKFYVDPTKEHRFSSKEEVQFYLKEGKPLYPASNNKLYCDTEGEDNIVSVLRFSPECLPYGWIKEMKYRKVATKSGLRKDAFYTDPESGFLFRSLKEVKRYLQTGELPKHAKVPRQSITDVYSFESVAQMPENPARRFNFSRHTTGDPSKKPIDGDDDDGGGGDDDDVVVGGGDDVEEGNKDLMRPTNGVLETREEFMEGGTEHECHEEVGTKTEIVGSNGAISVGEQEQREEVDPTRVQGGH